ncbi:MAG TPA: rhomboid family intramembrane serine protease [Gammaproteobacteria bacterium]|nr:rhomboid family intramembrane serine protease [Gammaproteobacteria bacterium]
MIADVSNNYSVIFQTAESQLPFMGYLLLCVWAFNIINWLFRSPLNLLGIYPRSAWGLLGIIFSPFLHANFTHLFFNSIPFFVLGMFLLTLGKSFFIAVSIIISISQGILVWLFGRKYIHIGASGVISGYFGFILGLAYLQPTMISILLAAVAIYYFGTILLGILPSAELVSWESHLAGLISGVVLVYVLWNYPQYELMMVNLFQ